MLLASDIERHPGSYLPSGIETCTVRARLDDRLRTMSFHPSALRFAVELGTRPHLYKGMRLVNRRLTGVAAQAARVISGTTIRLKHLFRQTKTAANTKPAVSPVKAKGLAFTSDGTE